MRRLVLAMLLMPAVASAQDWGDEASDEWAVEPVAAPPVGAARTREWNLTGFYRSDMGIWAERLQDDPFGKFRQSLDLEISHKWHGWRVLFAGHAEYDIAYLSQREQYDPAVLDTYEARLLHGEQYVAYGFDALEITIGRQIIAWGEGDVLSPLDIVNPRDMREPGLADLDDLRLSVFATRLGLFFGNSRLEAMVIHETYTGERAPPLGTFSPFKAIIANDPVTEALLANINFNYHQEQPRFALDQQMYLLRWLYKGPGLDLGLYAANTLDYQGVVLMPDLESAFGAQLPEAINIELDHRRYWLAGFSGAVAMGSMLYKWEVAATFDRSYNVGDPTMGTFGVEKGSLLTPMLSLTYTGLTDTTIGIEATKGFFLYEPDTLLFPADEPVFAVRLSHRALRETLVFNLAGTAMGWAADRGFAIRGDMTYELSDGLKTTLGFISYQPGNKIGPFYGFDTHDRVFARLRWDFVAY